MTESLRPADVGARLPRRRLLQLGGGLAVTAATAACGGAHRGVGTVIGPESAQVASFAESQRRRFPAGRVLTQQLDAAPSTVDIGGRTVQAWTYQGQLPGPLLRAMVGDRLAVRVRNGLGDPTTVHWHGLRIRNDMDGVPGVTQPPIAPGAQFDYEFVLADPGTYWYHSHVQLQRGRGLYGALLVDDPHDPGGYDVEYTVLLADWLLERTPEQVFAQLRSGTMGPGMGGMGRMAGMTSPLLGGDAGDVRYPIYLLNGRQPSAPATLTGKPGQRARIRLINAAEDTAFRVALGGYRVTVTHTDGQPATPATGDAVLIGMGERYDVTVTLGDGVFPLVAAAEGKQARAFGLVRTASGAAPPATVTPQELTGQVLTVADLSAAESNRLPGKAVDNQLNGALTGGMARYDWTINGRAYPQDEPLTVHPGQRMRLTYTNHTTMYHPMHLHGHTFAIARPDGTGPRKDTVNVLPGHSVRLDFNTDNPGQWFNHCHNEYHMAAGMAAVMSYQT